MTVSLVVPYIIENDIQEDIVKKCVAKAKETSRSETEIVLIDNGSSRVFDNIHGIKVHRNQLNIGVLPSFKQGYELSTGDVVCFIHSDILLHTPMWDVIIEDNFFTNPEVGLTGLFGAACLMPGGGREFCFSNMQGKEWGKCGCHTIAGEHHGNITEKFEYCAVFDGVGMFFTREVLSKLVNETDAFATWRAPHHFYDKMLGCKVADLGYKMGVIPIEFDHWSGATAGGSKIYDDSALRWLEGQGHIIDYSLIPDQMIYSIAEGQFLIEYNNRLPLITGAGGKLSWRV